MRAPRTGTKRGWAAHARELGVIFEVRFEGDVHQIDPPCSCLGAPEKLGRKRSSPTSTYASSCASAGLPKCRDLRLDTMIDGTAASYIVNTVLPYESFEYPRYE